MVFNSLNWPRGGWLETDLLPTQRIQDAATGQEVELQLA
jgi:hypothetical protein